MGCNCSEPKKGEDALLAEDIHEFKSKPNTQRRSNESVAESAEKGMNGCHPATAAWYIEPEPKTNGNILETLSLLIGDAHKNDIEEAMKSVKSKDDLNEVCQYLIRKATSVEIKASSQVKHECKVSVTSCESTTRLIIVFQAYIDWIKKAESKSGKPEESLYAMVEDKKLGKDVNTQQILNDYHHLLQYHNTDREFEMIYDLLRSKRLLISIDQSSIIWRHYRDRSVMVNKERKRLYFGYTASIEVGFIKLMDRIYCHFAYSFDIGMRYRMTETLKLVYATNANVQLAEDEKGDGGEDEEEDALVDAKLVCMSIMMKQKQTNLVNIIGAHQTKSNKFVSQKDHKTAATFYYKAHKARSDEKIEMQGKEYTEKDWYITPKYASLKEELINKCAMSPKIFDDLIVLSTLHFDSVIHQMSQQKMAKMNILALMAYCNHVAIQYELKQTYFRLTETETDFQWKRRHSALGHLGRLLCEMVSECGTICNETHVSYHSISIKRINATLFTFVAPTSTSRSMLVSLHYSSLTLHGKGTMIEVKGGKSMNTESKYFDCSFISDFAYEEEQLFITSQTPLELCSILDGIKLESYALFVFALRIITTAFGEVNEHWSEDRDNPLKPSDVALNHIPKKKVKHVKKLSRRIWERRAVECQPHLFGNKKRKKSKKTDDEILYQLVTQFAVAKREMVLFWFSSSKTIDLWPWIGELLTFMRNSCFCKTLKNDTIWVKLDLLALFFPHLECLTIADCPLTEYMLTEIDLFLQKLQMDPAMKFKNKKPKQPERQESDVFGNLGLDLDVLVDQLHSDKSHISFKDPSFDDTCDYRRCKMKEIKILESYENEHETKIKERVLKKFNKKFEKSGWTMVKAKKIMGNYQGFVIKKM